MKKLLYPAIAALMAAGLVSCEETDNGGFQGTNYINLTAATSEIYTKDDALNVEVKLTTKLQSDLTLEFVVNDTENILEIKNNPLTIKAGSLSASISINLKEDAELTETTDYVLSLSEDCVLPEKVAFAGEFDLTVYPTNLAVELTDDLKAVIAAYKTSTGVDLEKYLGWVNVSTHYEGVNYFTEEPEDEMYNTKTFITLSEASTAEQPVLCMEINAMGLQNKFNRQLRERTVENEEYWLDENALPCYKTLMDAINWTKDSKETFNAGLGDIKINNTEIEFLGTGEDSYGDEITIVPFDFYFSAYDRELNTEIKKDDEWYPDATANPVLHLNSSNILLEEEDAEEEEYYVEPVANISGTEMKFTFCIAGDGAYLNRVVATYTPIK